MISSPYRPERVSAPSVPLITAVEAKQHLRLDGADDSYDTLVDAFAEAAVAHLDGYGGIMGRCLVNQVWQVWFDCWHQCWRLPFPDVSAATVTVTTEAGATSTVSGDDYAVLEDHIGAYIRFDDEYVQPSADLADAKAWAVQITAGYGAAASDVPRSIRLGALLMVGSWFQNREAVNIGNITSELPLGAKALLEPHRRVRI